jgi:hypothetical protein
MYGSPVLHHLLQEAIETVIDFFGNLLEQGFDAWRERRRTRRASAGHHVGIDPKSPDDIRKPLIEDAGPDLYFFGLMSSSAVWIFLELGLVRFAGRKWDVGSGGGASILVTVATIVVAIFFLGIAFVGVLSFAAACDVKAG